MKENWIEEVRLQYREKCRAEMDRLARLKVATSGHKKTSAHCAPENNETRKETQMNITIDMARACHSKGLLDRMSKLIHLHEEILKHRADGASEKLDAGVCDLLTGSATELPVKIDAVFADMRSVRVNGGPVHDDTVSTDQALMDKIESVKNGLVESVAHAEALFAAAKARAAWRQKDSELVKTFETELSAFIEDSKTHNRECVNFEMAREAKAREDAEQRRRQIEWARKRKAEAEECLRRFGV